MLYMKCERIGSPRHLNTSATMFTVAVHYISINIQCTAAIVDCIHIESAIASIMDLLTLQKRILQKIFC